MNSFKKNFDAKSIKAIIFDMDGVLLDTETICDKCWKIAGDEFNLSNIEYATAVCRGKSRLDARKTLTEMYGSFDVEGFMARSHEIFTWIEQNEGIKTMYFAKDALETLSKKYRLALASSTVKENVYRQLENCELLKYFETVTTGDSVSHSKPDPEIYLKAVESLKLKATDCLAIEDSPNGISSAFNADVPVVMIPDKVIPDSNLESMCLAVFENLEKLCQAIM